MIYHFLKQIIKIALSVFFKKVVISGKENIPDKGPLIIVANHPNTFMDPFIIIANTRQRIGFVGNASIFVNKIVNGVFSYFHVIPIFRKKDVLPGVEPNNKKTFVKCHDYLDKQGTLLIFPEGNSYYELKLRKIKTGTARIALSFEESHNFEGKLKILPIALDYSDSIQFRSIISVTVNPPLNVHTYEEMYLNNEFDGVVRLTEDIKRELEKHIPHTSDKDQEEFLIKAHKFYAAYYDPMSHLYLNAKRSLQLRNQLSKALSYMYEHHTKQYQDIENDVYSFFNILKSEGLSTGFITERFLQKNKVFVCLNYFLKFLILLPLYMFGLLINYVPYILPSKIFEALKIDIEYKTPVEMTVGLITFPLFYILEIWLFRNYISTELWYSLLLLLIFPISGFISMYYYTEIKRFKRAVHFYFFIDSKKILILLKLRDKILDSIEEYRKSL